jgi:uncharacterized protein YggE
MNKLLRKSTKIAIIAAVLLDFAPAMAQTEPSKAVRTISVSGEAHEQVAPDQAILSVGLVSKDKVLNVAKKANDALADKLVAIAAQFKIPREKIATSNINISPDYNYADNKRQFLGYNVTRSLRITIDDISQQEQVLSAVVDAKIDQVNGVEFQLADAQKHEAALRVKAFNNAREKAEALAQAAGGKLGQALVINAGGGGGNRPVAPMAMMMKSDSSIAPNLPGLMNLQESVSVTFALE